MTFRKNYSNKFEVDDGLFDKKNRQMRRTFLLRMAVLRRFAYDKKLPLCYQDTSSAAISLLQHFL